MSNFCNICNKDITLLGEEGCEDCGLEYDPSAPDRAEELNFHHQEVEHQEYLPEIEEIVHESLDLQMTPPWDADSDFDDE